jgi:tetratricopeptide (TPR) repeat protein
LMPGADDAGAVTERVCALLGLSEATFPIEECFQAVGRMLDAIAAGQPLVLAVDDLHWAEDSLLDLVDHLRKSGAVRGCVIVGTARPELLSRRWSSDAIWRQRTVVLGSLSDADSDAHVREVLGDAQVPSAIVSTLVRAAEGNPLFLEQAVLSWIDDGTLVRGADGWTTTRDVSDVAPPVSVAAIFASRLDQLSTRQRRTVEAAAVIGPVFPENGVRAICGDEDGDVADDLEALVSAGLIEPVELPVSGGSGLGFVHASLREVAYDLTLKAERAVMHEAFARWRERIGPTASVDAVVGHHLACAYELLDELRAVDAAAAALGIRAARSLAAASRRALGVGDQATAARLACRALGVLRSLGPARLQADLDLIEATAGLLVRLGLWGELAELVTPHIDVGRGPLLRDLGVATCQLHRSDRRSDGYRHGQRLLEQAIAAAPNDPDAVASLAGTWKGLDDSRSLQLYERCLRLDPGNPYALGNVIELAVRERRDLAAVDGMRRQIALARERCRAEADAGANLPWAFFDMGKFDLLLRRPDAALHEYAKAVQLAAADQMLATSAASLATFAAAGELAGADWAALLLAVARADRSPSDETRSFLRGQRIEGVRADTPILVLAGGTADHARAWLDVHRAALRDSFDEFVGVIVSGGTGLGVAGLTGEIRDRHGPAVRAIGYLPSRLPESVEADDRYDEVRQAGDAGFSVVQTLSAFADLAVSGVPLRNVKLFGINGGPISAAEYRVALALGCLVGVVDGSGREADRLFADPDWAGSPNLVRLGAGHHSVRRFLLSDA